MPSDPSINPDDAAMLDWLRTINPAYEDVPEGWTPEHARIEAEELRGILTEHFGILEMHEDHLGTRVNVSFQVPPHLLSTPENPYVCLLLSTYARLTMLLYEWDVKPEHLEKLQTALQAAGFFLVPGRLYGNPIDNDWRYTYEFVQKGTLAPPGKGCWKNDDVFEGLF